ncbi:STELLO glycosyltransferase family protein [Sphingomonas radiodurans]|uniref:STELLO glycosyltransferase family protein n=1 Tax=Sphingomonas radiodurans TaxID=2890321 RepID=UPI001E2B4676|nr:STELLO glycosyltransferase family protein [Sphingomonas radiodurans]WBH17443.1 STELLO glycosyltransferase family protein [Sphingomonas radiodurans]
MSSPRYALVVTTINPPNEALTMLADGASRLDARFWVIGDTKSPADFALPGADYLDVPTQQASGFGFARACPTKHYARKNIGYLLAMRDGADVIVETDDDNLPRDGFWAPRERHVAAPMLSGQGWCNVYRHFSEALIWPRGLPLDRVHDPLGPLSLAADPLDCPIQQGLADDNPDVDAVYRLLLPLPQSFGPGTVILDRGTWCPFNSQNTTTFRPAFPLLYLPAHCSFRMTDIWRSFVAQRIAWANGWRVMFHGSTVWQERNAHDLMRDFADEVPGYLHNDRIRATLEDLDITGGEAAMPDDLMRCYRALIALGVVGAEEEALVAAWNEDLARLA